MTQQSSIPKASSSGNIRRKRSRFVVGKRRQTVLRTIVLVLILGLATNVQAQSSQGESSRPTAAQLQELVTPVALYPDPLVAQILAASQYPTQIVEAARWVQQNSTLKGSQLQAAVSKEGWDPSVMALAQFPSVLNNMNANLSWTSALGDAYYNEPQAVMNAIQALRQKAYQAGNLKTTPQQTVTVQGGTGQPTTVSNGGNQTIIIQPSNPQVVYVPTYNPTTVYGSPTQVYPGYSSADLLATSLLSFGVGMAVGAAVSGGGGWGCNWGGGSITHNNNAYIAHDSVWGPNRWAGYNPYNSYHPYSPYSSYHPYNSAYHPYDSAYHPYSSGYHPYNSANHPYDTGSHPFGQGSAYHPQSRSGGWDNNLNNFRGFDDHGFSGMGNHSMFSGFGNAGDTRMASSRGWSSLGGFGHGGFGGGGFHGFGGGGGFGHGGFGGGGGFGGFRGRR